MTIEEMKKAKATLGYGYERLAEECGLSPEGVRRIFSGRIKKPRASTMEALESVLDRARVEKCENDCNEYDPDVSNGT